MSSSLAWAAPIAKIATAPTQVVSRKLRIGILPATMPRVTDARARVVPRVGTRSVGKLPAACHSATRRKGHVAFRYLRPVWLTNTSGFRSEERRVGKECRTGGGAYQ